MIYTIENDYLKVDVCELGATLMRLIDKKSGTDLVLGYETEDDYLKYNGANIGASVGRNANRIGKAQFCLNDKLYKLSVNDNGINQLHGGGINGFAFKRWEVVDKKEDEISFKYFSKNGEEGFPGNLNVEVSYKLEGNSLTWSYSGSSDEDTILNMTNHSYFNLGSDNIFDLDLHITTDKYSPVDDKSLTLDQILDTKNTPYDFYEFRKVGDNLKELECGIDNNYVWENMSDKLMAELKNDKLKLNVYSDLPDMHLYTAYYLNGELGKYGKVYKSFDALCLECQYYPNGINYDNYIKPILKKDEVMKHYIRYEIENI